MRNFLVFLLVVACFLMLPAARGEEPAASTPPAPLKVICDFQATPFSYVEGLTKMGFEVDLMEAVAKELGTTVNWITQAFNIPTYASSLDAGTADMVIASISITPDREQRVLFSRPYFRATLAAATLRDVDWNHQRWSNGLSAAVRVGVQRRTTAEDWARKNLKATRRTYDKPGRVARALNNHDVSVVVMDEEILSHELISRKYKFKMVEKGFDPQDYGIAFARSNQALAEKVDAALEKLDREGTYDRIYEKWFGHLADLPKNIRPTRGDAEVK